MIELKIESNFYRLKTFYGTDYDKYEIFRHIIINKMTIYFNLLLYHMLYDKNIHK